MFLELTVVYAGSVEEGRGLHNPELARNLPKAIVQNCWRRWSRDELASALKLSGSQNVFLLQPVKRDELIEIYQSAMYCFFI